MSTITEIGVGFPGVASVDMVDETNGYVLTTLKAWGVCQPGINPDTDVTNANHKTYTNAAFDALGPYRSRDGGEEVVAWATDLARAYVGGA
jgi:hypothetical protein